MGTGTSGDEPRRGEERELKLGVPDEQSFLSLIRRAGGRAGEPVEQENHFFDSATAGLRARGIGLRIRSEGGRYTLTLKGPTTSGGDEALVVRAELEVGLEERRARAVLSGALPISALIDQLEEPARRGGGRDLLAAVRAAARESPLLCIGSFRNTRTAVETVLEADGRRQPVVLEFDRTRFGPDDVRLEVEMEIGADAPAEALARALRELFRSAGVEPRPTTGKLAYFQQKLDASRRRADT